MTRMCPSRLTSVNSLFSVIFSVFKCAQKISSSARSSSCTFLKSSPCLRTSPALAYFIFTIESLSSFLPNFSNLNTNFSCFNTSQIHGPDFTYGGRFDLLGQYKHAQQNLGSAQLFTNGIVGFHRIKNLATCGHRCRGSN